VGSSWKNRNTTASISGYVRKKLKSWQRDPKIKLQNFLGVLINPLDHAFPGPGVTTDHVMSRAHLAPGNHHWSLV